MRVTFNTFPDTLLGRLQALGGEQNKALTQLSTGQRIAAPSDDTPAMQRILSLRTEKDQNQQYYRNSIDGLEVSKTTFVALDQLGQLVGRGSELAAGISGITSDAEYKAKYSEINQLIEQGVNVANTKLRGSFLLAGDASASATKPFDASRDVGGKITTVTYAGSETSPEMNIAEGTKISAYTTSDENKDVRDALNKLIALRDAMDAKSPSLVLTARQALTEGNTSSEDKLLSVMSRAGSIQYRLENNMKDLELRYESSEKLISTDADVDFAEATVRLNRSQMAYQAAIQSGAKIQNNSLLDYLR
jgi:flagellar hook-associated protein 3 FlgL